MKQILILITSLLLFIEVGAVPYHKEQRKKVGIVLSGGGAKGVAHIGALKVVEELGIPVKFVGLGEKAEDLRVFDIEKYIYGLFKEF